MKGQNKKELQTERIARTLRKGEENKHFEMLNLCFNPWGSKEEWKKRYTYFPNFDLSKNVVVIEDNGEWAGGGTAWFRDATLKNNKKIMIYGAGDLYVHPNHRRKGIYSTAMQSLNDIARKRGAALGFAFPSIYGLAAIALPKYGFFDVLRPMTKILILNPEKFLQYFISNAQAAMLPPKFNGINIRMIVFFDCYNRKYTANMMFEVKEGRLIHVIDTTTDISSDLTIKADIALLLRILSLFYLRKRVLLAVLLIAWLRRRLKFRISLRFLKLWLGFNER